MTCAIQFLLTLIGFICVSAVIFIFGPAVAGKGLDCMEHLSKMADKVSGRGL